MPTAIDSAFRSPPRGDGSDKKLRHIVKLSNTLIWRKVVQLIEVRILLPLLKLSYLF